MKNNQIPVLAVWGRNDVVFVKEWAEAFKRDVPGAEVYLLDSGHFAVESHARVIWVFIRGFLWRKGI